MRKRYLGFFCLILILTVCLSFDSGLTETNFSVIGNRQERKLLFLTWGALVGNFYYLYMEDLMRQVECTDRMVRTFLLASLFFLMTGIGLPYLPKKVPGLSRLHVLLSFLAPVCMAVSQIRFLLLLQKQTGTIWKEQWCMQLFIGLGSFALLFGIGMVSSLLEIFLTAAVCLYLVLLRRKLEKILDNL